MTVSIGLAVYPDHAGSAERLERTADSGAGRHRSAAHRPRPDAGLAEADPASSCSRSTSAWLLVAINAGIGRVPGIRSWRYTAHTVRLQALPPPGHPLNR